MYRLTYKEKGEGGEYTFTISGVETDEDAAKKCRQYIETSEQNHGEIFIWGRFERIDRPEETTVLNMDELCPHEGVPAGEIGMNQYFKRVLPGSQGYTLMRIEPGEEDDVPEGNILAYNLTADYTVYDISKSEIVSPITARNRTAW